jgi:WD40 repeat protein
MAEDAITLRKTLAHLPLLERGYGYPLAANGAKGDRMSYSNGKSFFVRSLADPSEAIAFAGDHKDAVNVAVISNCGNYVASGDKTGRLIVYNMHNQQIKTGPCDYPVNKCVMDIAWSPDNGKIVAVGMGADGMARVIDRDTGNAVGTVGGHVKTILSCDFRQEKPLKIVCGGEDNSVTFHEGPPFKLGKKMSDNKQYVNKVKYAPDSSKFLSVSSDMSIHIYEGKTGELLKTIEAKGAENGHTGAIYSFAWAPDSQRFLTASADKTAKVWNAEAGTVEKTYTLGQTVNDQQLACIWHREYMCTLSLSGAINYLNPDTDGTRRVIHGHKDTITAVAAFQQGSVFYSADRSGVVCVWRDFNATWFTGAGHGRSIIDIGLSCDGAKLVTVGLDDKLRFNETKDGTFATAALALGGTPCTIATGKAHPDLVAVGLSQDKVVVVSGGNAQTFNVPSKPTSLDFSPDDSLLAVGTHKGPVLVFKVAGGKLQEAYELKEMEKTIARVTWSLDGKNLAVSAARRILIYAAQKVVGEWEYHEALVTDLAFGQGKVASVSNDLGIMVWKDLTTWSATRKSIKMAHREGILKCTWLAPDLLLTVGADSCMKVWNC